jgi:hypothetical protein
MSMPPDDARRRRELPVRIRRLQEPDDDDLSGSLDAAERVALVWALSRRMWELTGRPVPRYDRAAMPVRVVRRG